LSRDTAQSESGERISHNHWSPDLEAVTVQQRQPDLVGLLLLNDVLDRRRLKLPFRQGSGAASDE